MNRVSKYGDMMYKVLSFITISYQGLMTVFVEILSNKHPAGENHKVFTENPFNIAATATPVVDKRK